MSDSDKRIATKVGAEPQKPAEPQTVALHYIKSNHFRVIFAEGALGTIATNGEGICMSLFNQRYPIPVQQTWSVDDRGILDKPVAAMTRKGLVREVECEVYIPTEAAEDLVDWLIEKIEEAKRVRSDARREISAYRKKAKAGKAEANKAKTGKKRRNK